MSAQYILRRKLEETTQIDTELLNDGIYVDDEQLLTACSTTIGRIDLSWADATQQPCRKSWWMSTREATADQFLLWVINRVK